MSQSPFLGPLPPPIHLSGAATSVGVARTAMLGVDPAAWDGDTARTFTSQRTNDLVAAATARSRVEDAAIALQRYQVARVSAHLAYQGVAPVPWVTVAANAGGGGAGAARPPSILDLPPYDWSVSYEERQGPAPRPFPGTRAAS